MRFAIRGDIFYMVNDLMREIRPSRIHSLLTYCRSEEENFAIFVP